MQITVIDESSLKYIIKYSEEHAKMLMMHWRENDNY